MLQQPPPRPPFVPTSIVAVSSLFHPPHSIPSQLQFSSKSQSLPLCRLSHDEVCRLALDENPYLQSLLVRMYAASGAIDDALSVFSAVNHRHHQSFIWNHIIHGLTRQERYVDAGQLFHIMWQHGVVSDKFTFISMLTGCSNEECLDAGKRLHALVRSLGLHQNVVLATALVAMYQRCGSLLNAWKTFEEILQPDQVSWTSIISAHVHHDQNEQALHLYGLMLEEGFSPSNTAFACIVDACTNSKALLEGIVMHACVIEFSVEPDIPLENSFLKLYCLHASMVDAQHIFNTMQHRDIVSFNTLILGFAQAGNAEGALHVFSQLLHEGMKPNKPTYLCILEACINAEFEIQGMQLHHYILDSVFDSDVMITTKLVKMYGAFGSLQSAEKLFDVMKEHNMANIISWTTMISVCTQQGNNLKALCYHQRMLQEGIIKANKITLACLINALTCSLELIKVRHTHVYVLNCGLDSDIVVNNSLISMYGNCNSIEDARTVFDNLLNPDIISCCTMIEVYAQHCRGMEAIKLFTEMKEVHANEVIFVSVVDACTGSKMLIEGKIIHFCTVVDEFESEIQVINALENMYGKCGCLEDACYMFSIATEPNVVTWTTMIGTHAQFGNNDEALQLFSKMQQQGEVPNNVTFINLIDACGLDVMLESGKQIHAHIIECGLVTDVMMNNALIKMYGKCHSINDSWILFEGTCMHDSDSWTAMIAVCVQHGKDETALQLFDIMQHKGFQPNKKTFICILDACINDAAIGVGELIHHLIVHDAFDADLVVSTALTNFYGKCGILCSAQNVFDKMEKNNLLSWTTIVSIHAQHGKGKEAFNLCRKMHKEGFMPDEVTLLNLFVACSHSGLVDEGLSLFMSSIQSGMVILDVKHYVCMIDILGRAGQLNQAEMLVQHMPSKPTAVTLMSFLGSCRCQGDVERGERAAVGILGLDSEDSATYVMLSNIYADGGLRTMELSLAVELEI